MVTDVLLRTLEQFGHELLRQPDRLTLQSHVNFDLPIFGFINEKLAHTGISTIPGDQVFAHNRTAFSMNCSKWVFASVSLCPFNLKNTRVIPRKSLA